MKKLILTIFSIIFIFTACGTLQVADVARLSPGMTQIEVDRILGNPVRILSSSYIQDGEINVYEYITYRNESYAVEFLNGRLNRYDFMYENVPPAIIEPNPVPVYPVYPVRPTTPVRPQPEKPAPTVRPQPERPAIRPADTNKPETTRPTTPPSGSTTTGRPATRPTETSRPSSNSKPETSRPTTRPSSTTSTSRPATRTTTTETSTTKTNSEEKKTEEPSK